MKIGENEFKKIIITKDDEVIAVISDKELIEHDGYKVILDNKEVK
ncbi:hypothetical protein DE167_000033 [Clostridium beijerinckii]|uniref:Uncharacterized protein n=2 Tax=Clostridium beijerinckii TaxID=1520 RepID=A0AAX0B4T9_CLOBE|nr:hypothetical protein [Clostridium beijerinckii]NRT90036.1 hypothetical protein [Clostridium beijerinckii]NYC69567.1 hypothetical protein [Clostridium beijerinckii]